MQGLTEAAATVASNADAIETQLIEQSQKITEILRSFKMIPFFTFLGTSQNTIKPKYHNT